MVLRLLMQTGYRVHHGYQNAERIKEIKVIISLFEEHFIGEYLVKND